MNPVAWLARKQRIHQAGNNMQHEKSRKECQLQALLKQVAQGNEAALTLFFSETKDVIYGVALKITDSTQLAEEIVVEVYMQVWLTAQAFDLERGSVLAWLIMICRSRSFDFMRSKNLSLQPAYSTSHSLEMVNCHDNPPEDMLIASRSGALIHAALARLSPRDRQLIALAFFKGLTHVEIAANMDLPIGTVKSSLRRSLELLRCNGDLH